MSLTVNLKFFVPGYVFLRSISLTDISTQLGLVSWFVLEFFSPINQHNTDIICKLQMWFLTSCNNASSHLICMMGFERLYAIFQPISYRENSKSSTNVKLSVACILFSTLVNSSFFMWLGNDVGYCFGVQKDANLTLALIQTAFLAILECLAPMLIMIVINAILITKLKHRQSRLVLLYNVQQEEYILDLRQCLGWLDRRT